MQIAVGFEPRGLIANYVKDPVSGNYGVLLVLDAAKNVPGASREHATGAAAVTIEQPHPASANSRR